MRYPPPDLDLDDLFLFEAMRKVASDRTVSLNGVVFEVDAALVGERVTLRFDPAAPQAPVQVVHAGRVIERARRVDLYANCFVKRHRPSGGLQVDPPADALQVERPALARTSPLTMTALARDDRNDGDGRDGHDGHDHGDDRDDEDTGAR